MLRDKEQQCIRDYYNGEVNGYPSIARTLDRLQRNFLFTAMRSKVIDYVKKCDSCQKNKSLRHAKYSNLQMIPLPQQPWDEVTMDFITDLLRSKDPVTGVFSDAILVIVNKLTKYTHFVPYTKTITAEQLGYLVLDRLVRHHSLLLAFIIDRDKLFTSAY